MKYFKIDSIDLDTNEEFKELMKEKLQINCSTCGYCLLCSKGVDIPKCFNIFNDLFNKKKINFTIINYLCNYCWRINE